MIMDPKQAPVNDAGRYVGRPRLLFMVIFLSFFFGVQSLLSGLPGLALLAFSRDQEMLQRLLESTAFSAGRLAGLFVYQLAFSLVVLPAAYFLLSQQRESARRILKAVFAVDVFLFLVILLYYRNIQYRPPNAEQFYYDVFCTILEIVLIICLSHRSIVDLTRGRPSRDARAGS